MKWQCIDDVDVMRGEGNFVFALFFVCFKNGWRWIPSRRLKYQIGIKLEIIIWKLNITISRTTCITNENKTKSNKGHFLLCYKTYVYKCNLGCSRFVQNEDYLYQSTQMERKKVAPTIKYTFCAADHIVLLT